MRRNRRNDFWGSFSRSLNLQPAANIIAGSILQQKEDEKLIAQQAAEEEKQQQGRQAVMDLFSGGQNLRSPSGQEIPFIEHLQPNVPGIEGLKQGFTQTQKSTYKDYTQQEKLEKIGQIFPDPSQYFNAVSKLLNQEQKQKKTVKIGGQTFEESPEFENIPIGEPLFTEPKKDIRTEVIKATEIEGQEGFKGYAQKVKREYDPEGNIISQELVNNPYKVTKEKTTEYGGKYTDASTDVKKELGGYRKKQQEIKARLDLVRKGVPVFEESWWGGKLPLSEDDLRNQLNQAQGEYQEYIKNTEPATVVDIRNNYVKDFGEVDPSNADDLFNYYANIYDDYRNKKIEPVEYIYLVNDFTAKYGFDPQAKFDSALNGR